MSERRISQLLDQQLEPMPSLDPFSQAQAQSIPMQAFQNEQQVQPVDTQLMTTMPQGKSQDSAAFGKSGLPSFLKKIGIDDKGLALNALGRVQLIGRLKNRFGEQYNQNTEALDALAKFDEEIEKYPMDTQKKMNMTVKNGERTLKALLGG